jgi:AraC family transcriptional regulator, regulatory protein of adaptative response / methylphosphotriester-DNA alkyltransferase methyltransferase
MELTDELMWQATISNDRCFDGVFYYSVKSTGIFCRPSCKSKLPNRENVSFFPTPDQAMEQGYRPCKRCRPDLLSPATESIQEIVTQMIAILQTEYDDPLLLTVLPGRVGVSPFHLQRLFKKQTGYTPKEFLRTVKIDQAKELLVKDELNNTEICYGVGFQSLSSFYANFRMVTGISPREYKRKFCQSEVQSSYETCV